MIRDPLPVLPAVRWHPDSGFAHERDRVEQALALGAAGFIIFGGTVEGVSGFTRDVAARAGRPLLIGSDLERGAGQQVAGLTEFPPPRALASLGDLDLVRTAARVTAEEALSVGINWVFAPVADLDNVPENPIVQTRSFGDDPETVARAVAAWVESCESAGALACVKHYPGHGRTTADSHRELPVVSADLATVARDELPFRRAIEANVASVMTAHVAVPALDPSGMPATFSAPIIGRLRSTLGHRGLVVTDAMIMEAARRGNQAGAAVAILNAGVDLLLYPEDPVATCRAVAEAARSGTIPEERWSAIQAGLRGALERAKAGAATTTDGRRAAELIAARLLASGMIRGTLPRLRSPLTLVVVDDDRGGPYPPSPTVELEQLLADSGLSVGPGGSRILAVFNEPRGWKGRAGWSPEAARIIGREAPGADLVVLFGHSRLVDAIPGTAPVLVAWHRQMLMQRQVSRYLARG